METAPVRRPSTVRKLIHMATAIVPAAGWFFSYSLALGLSAAFLVASLAVEMARRWWPWVNQLLWKLLPTTFRAWEGRRILGSTWFSVGMLVTLLLFGKDVGGTAVLFLAWGDPLAEIVGRRWGRRPGEKTLAGSAGCFGACLLAGVVGIGLGGLSPWAVVVGAFVATLAERWSFPPDDNLWMPFLSALAMAGVSKVLGGQVVLFPVWI